jgi:hypothetical protein
MVDFTKTKVPMKEMIISGCKTTVSGSEMIISATNTIVKIDRFRIPFVFNNLINGFDNSLYD